MTELELFAVVWAIRKCQLYLRGLANFLVEVDHKPLIPILNDYTMDNGSTPRIQLLLEKLASFSFTASWIPGKTNLIADALSRAPVSNRSTPDTLEEATRCSVTRQMRTLSNDERPQPTDHDPALEFLNECATSDYEYNLLRQAITSNDPTSQTALPFKSIFASLSVIDNLVLYGTRIVVPKKARHRMLTLLHIPHQGMDRSKQRARQIFYWPGMSSDIENHVASCEKCLKYLPSQKQEPLILTEDSRYAFEETSADLFSYGNSTYMVYVDRFSGWPVLEHFGTCPSTSRVITSLKKIFCDYGVPRVFASDGGKQFDSAEFRAFCTEWHIQQRVSSPGYAQSNGHAEAAVKAMKALVKKYTNSGHRDIEGLWEAVLEWRNVPRQKDGLSPAQIRFGHSMRTRLPAHPSSLQKQNLPQKSPTKGNNRVKQNYDKASRSLRPLQVGTTVIIQDQSGRKEWNRVGIVTASRSHRDYDIELPSGRTLRRNRRHLYPTTIPPNPPASSPAVLYDPSQKPRRSSRKTIGQVPHRFQF
ncbi:uncharacterized protein K02A2.6-like [Tigriopus californicus]|uniref:uncharacterized protein K02A2.6-like n=1 Tax=Tigriopus californicus TaxID=6832 RepID=UPI0027DA076A|nr:uncharacterized protein K02A2.6-like [Tigriopus californicus]